MRVLSSFLFFAIIYSSLQAQRKTDTILQNILSENKDTLFQKVLAHRDFYRLQIIYTQINRDKNNKPSFKNYYFNVDSLFYFNPASTVKLPLAALSLEKLNELKINGVNKYTSMQFDSAYSNQVKELYDSTSETNLSFHCTVYQKSFFDK